MSPGDVAVIVAVIAGAGTVLGSVITQALSRRADRQAAAQELRREPKTKLYDSFLEFWFHALMWQQLGESGPPSPEESQEWFVTFTRDCIPWASDGFIRAYSAMRKNFFSPPGTSEAIRQQNQNQNLNYFEKVLFEIRLDLGHENKGIDRKDLLALWINDIDELPNPLN